MHTPSLSNHLTAFYFPPPSKVLPGDPISIYRLKSHLYVSLVLLPKIPIKYLQLPGKQFHLDYEKPPQIQHI